MFLGYRDNVLDCRNNVFGLSGKCFWAVGIMFLGYRDNVFGLSEYCFWAVGKIFSACSIIWDSGCDRVERLDSCYDNMKLNVNIRSLCSCGCFLFVLYFRWPCFYMYDFINCTSREI